MVGAPEAAPAQSSEKTERAKTAAAHFLDLFNQSLDYGVPYREMYIKESVSRGEKIGTSPEEIAEDKLNDDVEIAMMNLWYLRTAYVLTHNVDRLPQDIRAAHGEQIFPYFAETSVESARARKRRLANPDQFLKTYLRNARRLANLYRRYLSPEMFSSESYRAKLRRSQKDPDSNVRIEKSYGYLAFENRDVYKVVYGGVEYWLVEVDAKFKVIHINPLPGFSLA